MFEKIKEIYNDYKEDFLKFKNKINDNIKYFIMALKEKFKNPTTKKKYLTISLIFVILNLLIANLYFTYSYYYGEDSVPLITATVGNVFNNKYDYVLLVYLENATQSDEYHLVSEIPTQGYTYSGYKCENGTTLIYNEELNETEATVSNKDVCRIYFKLTHATDVNVEIMLEDEMGNNTLTDSIPTNDYRYDRYTCDNNSEVSFVDGKINVSASGKDNCTVYFVRDV